MPYPAYHANGRVVVVDEEVGEDVDDEVDEEVDMEVNEQVDIVHWTRR